MIGKLLMFCVILSSLSGPTETGKICPFYMYKTHCLDPYLTFYNGKIVCSNSKVKRPKQNCKVLKSCLSVEVTRSNGWEVLSSDMTLEKPMILRRVSYQIPRKDWFWNVVIYYESGDTLKFGWGRR